MPHDVTLLLSFSPPHDEHAIPDPAGHAALVDALLTCPLIPDRLPDELCLDSGRDLRPASPWRPALARKRRTLSWDWDRPTHHRTFLHASRLVDNLGCQGWSGTAASLLAAIGNVPFLWMSAVDIEFWGAAGRPIEYLEGPGFGTAHYGHGWLVAFQGELGHRQLVSRRWLAWQPWRLHRDEARDISGVEYHDPDADPITALEQARVAHRAMGINRHDVGHDPGGFIQARNFQYRYPDLGTTYDPSRHQLVRVVPPGRSVDTREMLEACAHRRYQPQGRPVDSVAYVFMTEADARRQLHDLWLRGLEVRAMVAGREVRLDDRYEPPPHRPPGWVDGTTPDAAAITTAQPVFDRDHDHAVIDKLTVAPEPGRRLPEVSAEVLARVDALEQARPSLHARIDQLHDALGDARHDAADPTVAAELLALRASLCGAWRQAMLHRDAPEAAATLTALLDELRARLA